MFANFRSEEQALSTIPTKVSPWVKKSPETVCGILCKKQYQHDCMKGTNVRGLGVEVCLKFTDMTIVRKKVTYKLMHWDVSCLGNSLVMSTRNEHPKFAFYFTTFPPVASLWRDRTLASSLRNHTRVDASTRAMTEQRFERQTHNHCFIRRSTRVS